MRCNHISGCTQDSVISLIGLGAFEFIPFCEEHAKGYVEYLRELYEKYKQSGEEGYNRDTLYCKYTVSRDELGDLYKEVNSEGR